jgi:hypothetical protein
LMSELRPDIGQWHSQRVPKGRTSQRTFPPVTDIILTPLFNFPLATLIAPVLSMAWQKDKVIRSHTFKIHKRSSYVFGPKRDKVTGERRKLHIEELNDLYSSPNIVQVIKSRRMRWAGHVECIGEGRGVCTGFW